MKLKDQREKIVGAAKDYCTVHIVVQ